MPNTVRLHRVLTANAVRPIATVQNTRAPPMRLGHPLACSERLMH
jgi:hypothetical protein